MEGMDVLMGNQAQESILGRGKVPLRFSDQIVITKKNDYLDLEYSSKGMFKLSYKCKENLFRLFFAFVSYFMAY